MLSTFSTASKNQCQRTTMPLNNFSQPIHHCKELESSRLMTILDIDSIYCDTLNKVNTKLSNKCPWAPRNFRKILRIIVQTTVKSCICPRELAWSAKMFSMLHTVIYILCLLLPMSLVYAVHCVQKKTPTRIFFHISMSDV